MSKKSFKALIITILILVVFFVWLFGFRIAFIKVDKRNLDKYETTFRGERYINQPAWRISDKKFIGYAEGFSYWVYKSTGDDKNKFLEVWKSFNKGSLGYGTFYREDLILTTPSSVNTESVFIIGSDSELRDDLQEGILIAFDSYINDEALGVSKESVGLGPYVNLICFHSEYNLSCKFRVTKIDEEYYIEFVYDDEILIPISRDIGEQLLE